MHGHYAVQHVAAKQPKFEASGGGQTLSKDAIYFDQDASQSFDLWLVQSLGDWSDADKAVFIILEPDTLGSWSFWWKATGSTSCRFT